MADPRKFAHYCWVCEIMERLCVGEYCLFTNGQVAKVTAKRQVRDGFMCGYWRLSFDRAVSEYIDGYGCKDYGYFSYDGECPDRGRTVLDYRNNIRGLMHEDEYQAYMAVVEKEREEEREYQCWLEEQKRKEEEELKAKEEARKKAIIEKEVRAKLETEYEAKLKAEIEKVKADVEQKRVVENREATISDAANRNESKLSNNPQYVNVPKMMRNGLEEVVVMLGCRKQGRIARAVEDAKTKGDFENCIELLNIRKQTGLAKQLKEILENGGRRWYQQTYKTGLTRLFIKSVATNMLKRLTPKTK